MKFLVTGGTGFVGSYLVPKLSQNGIAIQLLVRPASLEKAKAKFSNLKNVEFIAGDFSISGILQDVAEISQLKDVTDVLHLGALYDLEADETENYLANVVGTQNLLDLCLQLPRLKTFHHISTVAIAGNFKGTFKETFFNVRQTFSNPYARTKFRAEGLVGAWIAPKIKRRVYRLGVIIGNSRTGEILKADGPYYLFKSLKKNFLFWKTLAVLGKIPIPFDPRALIPLLPVDLAADALAKMVTDVKDTSIQLKTYNVVGAQIPVRDILTRAFREFGIPASPLPTPRVLFPSKLVKSLGLPVSLLDYMFTCIEFDQNHLRQDFPEIDLVRFENFSDVFFRWSKENL